LVSEVQHAFVVGVGVKLDHQSARRVKLAQNGRESRTGGGRERGRDPVEVRRVRAQQVSLVHAVIKKKIAFAYDDREKVRHRWVGSIGVSIFCVWHAGF